MTLVDVTPAEARAFVSKYHYSGTASAGVAQFGWEIGGELVGVSIYNLGTHDMRKGVFGEEFYSHVWHHHRLAILPTAPKGTAGEFLGACLRAIQKDRPDVWAIVTYADLCQGHNGTIYRATNAIPCGIRAKGNIKYRDQAGAIRITQSIKGTWPERRAKAAEMGWTEIKCQGKVRYVWLLGKGEKKLVEVGKEIEKVDIIDGRGNPRTVEKIHHKYVSLLDLLKWERSEVPPVPPLKANDVREWAKSKGYEVGERGRIARELVALYRNRTT